MTTNFKIQISGRVQGVGFRPFVFSLANNHGLNGIVSNNEKGVLIELNCVKEKAVLFLEYIKQNPPPLAVIQTATLEAIEAKAYSNFSIIPTSKNAQINLPLTSDFSICYECKSELTDAKNRRYNYPFISCVNCGQRYAVTKKFPFERENTSIADFEMCALCLEEYTNPKDRRFHSQTNSCSSCGISLFIQDKKGNKIEIADGKIIESIASYISQGNIVAIKNTSGYLLCCDASNALTVRKLRGKKYRPKKPFAVMYPSLEVLKQDLTISKEEEKEITTPVSPIVIISSNGCQGNIALNEVAPNLNQIGVMLPYSGLMYLIMNTLSIPLVATSGNISGSPIISEIETAQEKLSEVADYFLYHDLDIVNPQDDSVIKFSPESKQKIVFRRSRGLAPNYLDYTAANESKVLAMGSHLKNTISFSPNSHLYVSQYLGNLDEYEVCERYEKTITQYLDFFETKPDIILVDKHKFYKSTQVGEGLAENFNIDTCEIQHHKAHFASVLGEHNLFTNELPHGKLRGIRSQKNERFFNLRQKPEALNLKGSRPVSKEKVLGVIWDGTGLGDDEMIWGGEFFTYEKNVIERITHFEYFDWMLGDKMAKEPRLSLLSLSSAEMDGFVKPKFTSTEWNIYQKKRQSNTLKTSSVGRLFDAVASLLGLIDVNTYEGEAAVLLENCIEEIDFDNLKNYLENEIYETIPTQLIINRIATDKKSNTSNSQLAANFIYTLACSIIEVAKKHHIKTIAMSGGVFQNATLIDMVLRLSKPEFVCKFNIELPPNDENISFGQVMYYQNLK